jgi:hypothetical protein
MDLTNGNHFFAEVILRIGWQRWQRLRLWFFFASLRLCVRPAFSKLHSPQDTAAKGRVRSGIPGRAARTTVAGH